MEQVKIERKKYMRDNRKFADNEIVYVNSTYNIAEKCKITKFVQKESRVNKPVYALHSLDNLFSLDRVYGLCTYQIVESEHLWIFHE